MFKPNHFFLSGNSLLSVLASSYIISFFFCFLVKLSKLTTSYTKTNFCCRRQAFDFRYHEKKNDRQEHFLFFNPLPNKPILGSSNSAVNKDMMSKTWTNWETHI